MKKLYLILALAFALVAFTSNESFSQQDSLIFTTSGTFTVPAGVTSVNIEVVGAGGNGWLNGGGGGGGGGYAKGTYEVTPSATLNVTVGTGGGGAAGGTTSVNALISATGGGNGYTVPNPMVGGGGTGGVGTGGTIANRTGGNGGGGYWTFFGGGGAGAAGSLTDGSNGGNTIVYAGNCKTPGGAGGTGGGVPGGNGGKGAGFLDSGCNTTNPAANGSDDGGAGGGGNGNGGVPGNGANGYCKISWDGSAGNPVLMQNGTVSTCSGIFYDSGGPDSPYQASEDLTMTINPSTPGGKVKLNFTLFDTENNFDFLKIYDGPSINAPLLGNYSGTNLPPETVASLENGTGALTFHFTSDGSAQGAGWAADINCLSPMDHDLMGASVSGPTSIEVGATADYTVTITNVGTNPETGSNYTVALYDGNNTLIGTANGINIAAGESQSFVFPWTPNFSGPTYLYGKVTLYGDQNPLNDQTPDYNVTVMPTGQVDLVIGTGTEAVMLPTPIDGWFGYSFSQTIYLQSEINIANKRIFQIAYQYAGVNPNMSNTVEVWLGHTNLTELTATVPLSGFTKVYDGPFVVHAGETWSVIPIDGFYYNNTDNLIITVIEKTPGYTASTDLYYSTANTLPQNLSVGAQNDPNPYDPNNLPAGSQIPYRANIKLWFGDMPTDPVARTTPAALDFGAVEAITGKIMNVEVMNAGGGTLELTGASLTNDHYSLLNTTFPISLGIGEKHIFEVQFMPTDPVAEQGVLTFLMDPGIPGSKSVQLSGVGLRYGVLREGFEGEQFPPLGWIVIDANNDGKGWLRNVGFAPTGQTAPHTGIACASLDVYAGTPGQLGYNDWLITPRMTYQDGDIFQFYIKRLADQAGQIWKILISTTGTDISDFTPIDQISDPPLSYQEKNYNLSQHGLINGDKFYIAFQFNAVWCWPGVIDDILGSVIDGHQKDLMALGFTGSDIVYENATNNYQAVIGNNGIISVAAGAYTVQACAYVNGIETIFGTAPGVLIAAGETKTIPVPVTIPLTGMYGLYSKIIWSEDQDPTNNISELLEVEVIGSTKIVKNIGSFPINQQTPFYYLYPINFSDFRGGSLHECLYYNNELNTGGIVERLSYYSSFANSAPQRKIKVWMTQTSMADFDASGIPASQMTLVFDGKIDIADGQGKVNIELTHPFNYTGGGNLAVMVYYYDGGAPYINDNSLFAYQNIDSGPNRNLFDDWFTTIDPNDLTHVAKVPNFPLTTLMFETGNGLGNLFGKVLYQDNSAPVEGAQVVIANPDYPESNGVIFTDANGDYSAPYLLSGTNLTVTISKFGYSDDVYNNVTLEPGGNLNLGNAYLVTRPHIALSGHVRTSDTGDPAALALVKITGMENYETTTNDQGDFEFPSIWGSTTYHMEIYYGGYQTYISIVDVPATNFVMDTITLLENAPAPNLVHAVEQGGNALVTWYAAGALYPMEWRRDDGVAQGVLITPGSPGIVTGSTWNWDAALTDVSWYIYSFPGYQNSTQVMITFLGLNPDGSPDAGNVIYVQEFVPNHEGWNSCHLSQTVSAPNGFFVGISGYDNTFVLAYDDGEGETYVWEARTQWGNGMGSYIPLENGTSPPLRANIFIRAAGLTYGPFTKSIGKPQASYQILIPEGKSLLPCRSIEKFATGQPVMKLPAAPAFSDRSFLNYNVYRRLDADTTRQQMNTSPVNDTSFVDPTWNGLTYGLYRYGVEAEYTNGVKSTMSVSNILEKDMRLMLNLTVNTNTGVPGISAGALVTLTNQNGNVNYIFHAVVGATGSVAIPNVMKGIYTLNVTHVGFENYTETDIDFDIPGTTVDKTVMILEHIFNPYDAEVITNGQAPQSAKFKWDQAPVFDDVESYEPFLIDNIGDWTVIDQDGQPTVYPAGVTFPHAGEASSFMSFNYQLTTPPLSVEYWGANSGSQYFASFGSASGSTSNWLISKKQNHSLPFTFSFYAKSITENYGLETFRIGYSTGGNNTTDFVFITGNETALTYWTKFTYQIPAEAKYVAIRHNHTGFALLVDDITLGVETDGAIPANGFSVYLDNVEVANGLTTPEYTFTGLIPGNYTAGVKGHFYTGESQLIEVPFVMPVGTTVNFHVNDDLGAPVDGANVKILYNNNELFSSLTVNGNATFEINPGVYHYQVSKDGYDSVSAGLTVDTTTMDVNVVLNHLYNLTFMVKNNDNQPIGGATVVYRNESQATTADGSASFTTIPGTYSYAVTHPLYNRVLASVTVSTNASVTVTMPPLTCEIPGTLTYEQYYNNIQLNWQAPVLGNNGTWLHWDVTHGNNIGTGGPVDFDIAQRFVPEDLTLQDGKYLTRVLFFPNEPSCTYSIRIWTGGDISAPETLLVDQVITNPVIAQWNEFFLNTPVLVDATKELWIGVRNNTTTGHPAGCDIGPAIDGKGNMINLAGTGWQTLLQVAPTLNYNWNIRGLLEDVGTMTPPALTPLTDGDRGTLKGELSAIPPQTLDGYNEPRTLLGYNIFKNDTQLNTNPVTGLTYADNNLAVGTYLYKLTALYSNGCVSDYSNTITVEVTEPVCPAPANLSGSQTGDGQVTLAWERPTIPGESQWITYSGAQANSIGTNGVTDFDIAQRFTPGDFYRLGIMDGSLTKVDFFPYYQDCIYSVRIWVGGNANAPGEMVVDQVVSSFTNQTWNEIILNNPIQINTSQELWIGIRCNTTGGRPAACDAGPAIGGRGNMIYWQGVWKTLTQVNPSLDYNWCVKGYVDVSAYQYKSDKSLEGYKVFRDGTFLATVTDLQYIDHNAPYDTNTYCVRAVYDFCESQDICADVSLYVGISENDFLGAKIYPNPASGQVNIFVPETICRISLVNYLGLTVYAQDITGSKLIKLNTDSYPAGSYLVRFVTKDGNSFTRKVVIKK